MPGQFLVDIVTYEVKNIQTHGTVVDQLAVADDVLQIAHQAQFEEHHRVDALLAALPIIIPGKGIEEIQVDGAFQPPVKIVVRYPFAHLEAREQLFLVTLFSLHT